ncbi:MAG: hypothetical protein B9S34_09080 [Opitutia bacterium Tous-C1TDCM]|nr:MAG: hypothetical protein B9S34_09080 [Opitutae bacterium Tous-C1TDCM]
MVFADSAPGGKPREIAIAPAESKHLGWFVVLLPFALLTFALAVLWWRGERRTGPAAWTWLVLLASAVAAGWFHGILQPVALPGLALFALAAFGVFRPPADRRVRLLAHVAFVGLAAALMTHQWPGFANPRVIHARLFTPDALPFRLHLNFDKACLGLLILALGARLLGAWSEFGGMLRRLWPVALGTVAVLMALALVSGYVRFAPKLPPETALWLWANLCFTCVAEEALFRGYLQNRLAAAWQNRSYGPAAALVVAAVAFGLAHAGGGLAYVALSTLAGLGYGWAYLRTGRIEAAILAHFALNAVHFLGFTYPALARN